MRSLPVRCPPLCFSSQPALPGLFHSPHRPSNGSRRRPSIFSLFSSPRTAIPWMSFSRSVSPSTSVLPVSSIRIRRRSALSSAVESTRQTDSATFLPPHIELYLTAPTDHFLGARTESWLKVLLTHELTHYVHASMDRGFFYALSRVFGPDAAGAHFAFLPGWMIEGPSTNAETIFTAGGRGETRCSRCTPRLPWKRESSSAWSRRHMAPPSRPPGRIYVGGYILVDFLLSTYGRDAFQRIMDAYLGFPFFGPWSAIRKVTGKSASEVFDSLKKHLEEKYRQTRASPPVLSLRRESRETGSIRRQRRGGSTCITPRRTTFRPLFGMTRQAARRRSSTQ